MSKDPMHPTLTRRRLLALFAALPFVARARAAEPTCLEVRRAEALAAGRPLLVMVLNQGAAYREVSYGQLWAEILLGEASALAPLAGFEWVAADSDEVLRTFPEAAVPAELPLAVVAASAGEPRCYARPTLKPWPLPASNWTWVEYDDPATRQARYDAAHRASQEACTSAIAAWLAAMAADAGAPPGDGKALRARLIQQVPGAVWARHAGCGWVPRDSPAPKVADDPRCYVDVAAKLVPEGC